MKKKHIIILIAAALALLIGGGAALLFLLPKETPEVIHPAENTYAPRYESFYDGENDPGITIDGVLDEEIWQNKNWFKDAYLSKKNVTMPSWHITTHMTDLGVYLAARIDDTNILNDGQHTMEGNSSLEFYYFVSNVGEEISGRGIDRGYFAVDMRGDVHQTTGRFKRAVVVDGELNSGNTKSATMEMFFPWDFFRIDPAKGIPEQIYFYPIYCAVFKGKETITTSISSMDSVVKAQLYLYKDYWRFNKDGYVTPDREGAVVGDSLTGLAKTGNWDISKEADGIVRSANGTREHYMYFTGLFGSDYIFESTIVPMAQKAGDAKAGFYFLTGDGQYHLVTLNTPNSILVDSVNGTKNLSRSILSTYNSKTDIWDNPIDPIDNPDAAEKEGVKLTAVKQGGRFWYFLDDRFVAGEQIDFMDAEVIPAFYAWAADVVFKDYDCREANDTEIRQFLNEHGVYSVEVKVNGGGGTAEASEIAVADGQAYDLTFTCNSGYEVASILINGENVLEDAKARAEAGRYTVQDSHGDQEVVVTFQKCEGAKLTGIVYGEEEPITANLTVTSTTNGLLRYEIASKEEKGYQLVIPLGDYRISASAENYVTDSVDVRVAGETEKDVHLKLSMFASQVRFGGRTVSSNMRVWDRTEEPNGIIRGSYNNGTSLQPLYFAKTGSSAWFHASIRYATKFIEGGTYQPDLLGGLFISDGARTGWFGIRQHGIVYNNNWIEHVIGYDVLSTWNKAHQKADVDMILQDGVFHIFVDDIFVTTLAVDKILPGADPKAELAFGLAMHADKASDIEFSNISFRTDREGIAEDFAKKQASYTIPDGNVFTNTVTVNGASLDSKPYSWNLSEIASNTVTAVNSMSTQPIWLKKTGSTALVRMTVSRVDAFKGTTGYETQPMAGIVVSDGERQGYVGVRSSAIVTNDNWDHCIGRDIMASWSGIMSAEMDVALKDDELHIFLDGVLAKTVKVSDVIPGVRPGAVLALGVTSESSGKTASVKFAEVSHTTDAGEVNAFLDSKDPRKSVPSDSLFAGVVSVNGKEAESVVPVWDLTNIRNNIAVGNNGTSVQPLLFKNTAKTALIQTTVRRLDDSSETGRESQPMAGIYVTDGTHAGFLGVRAYSVVYGSTWLEKAIGYDVFVTWSAEHQTADLDFVLKEDAVEIYVDGIVTKRVALNDIAPGISVGSGVALGIVMESSGKTARMEFGNVRFSNDASDVDAYLDAASGGDAIPKDSIFASKVQVNGQEVQSIIPIWDLSEIANRLVTGTNGSASQPLYFKATGAQALLRMKVIRVDDKSVSNRETQPMAGLLITDGTHSGAVGVRASAVVTTADNNWDHCIGRDLFATWSSITSANLDFVLKNNELRIYVDDVLQKRLNLQTVVPGFSQDAAAAFGLVMESSGKNAVMRFENVTFTTDVDEVDAYLDYQNYDPSVKDFIEYARALGNCYENGEGSAKIPVSANTTIFIGDSFFERKRFWTGFYTNDYPNADVFLAGIGSTTTAHWAELIDTVFHAYGDQAPKNIVMHLGTNDLFNAETTSNDVVNGLKNVFGILHAKYPATPIYYFGITHRGDGSAADRINAANAAVASYSASQDYLTYIDTPSRITPDMLNADKLHPKAETYSIFVRELARAGCVILDKEGNPLPAPEFETLSGLFADEVTVNGKTLTSEGSSFDISGIDSNRVRTTSELGGSLKPIYFKDTGKTMLLHMEVTVTADTEKDPMAGIWLSDGTRRAYLGIRGNSLLYSPENASWNAWVQPAVWPYSLFTPAWGGNKTATIDMALKEDTILVRLDGRYDATYNLYDLMPNLSLDDDLAFALVAFTEGTRKFDMTFDKITFSTDEVLVDAFLNPAEALSLPFADKVTVNGKTVLSSTDHWDVSKQAEGTMRATSELASTLMPMYFASTGRSALLQTVVTVTNNTAGDPMAGLWMHDGTSRAFIGVRGGGLYYGKKGAGWDAWYGNGTDWPVQELAPGWGGKATVKIDILVQSDTITVYVDDIYSKALPFVDIFPDLGAEQELAFGLVAYTYNNRIYDMTFDQVNFTTNEAEIAAFVAAK